jgi:hypothetical protein
VKNYNQDSWSLSHIENLGPPSYKGGVLHIQLQYLITSKCLFHNLVYQYYKFLNIMAHDLLHLYLINHLTLDCGQLILKKIYKDKKMNIFVITHKYWSSDCVYAQQTQNKFLQP